MVGILCNVLENNKKNIVILDRSCFYPTSGGQQNDVGTLTIKGEEFQVVNVEKVGKCVLHVLDKEIQDEIEGTEIKGKVD